MAASFLDLIGGAGTKLAPMLSPGSGIPGEPGLVEQAQAKAAEIGGEVKEYAYAQLTLQAISTLAIAGIFLIQLAQSRKGD